jgi:O-acetyl-ADP-ribose deacetylase (regulator of RNase III)
MIEYRIGNLLDVTEGIIAHGCNCKGVMGSGVARAIRDTYPKVYDEYASLCHDASASGTDLLGENQYCRVEESRYGLFDELVVVNMFTQNSFGSDGRRYVSYDAVDTCFASLVKKMKKHGWMDGIDTIHIPQIGSGLGGGKWSIIESIIDAHTKDFNVIVWALNKEQLVNR